MKMVRGYKTELDLNNAQTTACLHHAGVARFAYNWGLKRYQEELPIKLRSMAQR